MGMEKDLFEEVYEEHFSYIYNYVYVQILHRERTEDLVSDIFIKAMGSYDRYDPSRAQVKTWLTSIARNTLIDEYRKGGAGKSVSLDDEENDVEPFYEDDYTIYQEDDQRLVRDLLTRLTEPERELIAMVYFQEMKNDQIGKVLGINAKAVSERHRRLLAKCRKLLGT